MYIVGQKVCLVICCCQFTKCMYGTIHLHHIILEGDVSVTYMINSLYI